MENNNKYIMKTFNCEKCGRKVECKIEKKQIEDLKDSQLFNFVLMHANDHTLIVSIDGRGNIRRSRIASLSSNLNFEENLAPFQDYQIIEECNNIVDAFNIYLKKSLSNN